MRTVEVVCHVSRAAAQRARSFLCEQLLIHRIAVAEQIREPHERIDGYLLQRPPTHHSPQVTKELVGREIEPDIELVICLGGDGTLLGAASRARALGVPLIGINVGHLGFLTEVEADAIEDVVSAVVQRNLRIEPRMVLDVEARLPEGETYHDWALNEVAIVRTEVQHPAHIGFGVDGHGVSTYGADGLILATPTGSTAYSYSAGGPIVWPDVEAVVVAPLAAHGLFTRPLVVSPKSVLSVNVLPDQDAPQELVCDGIRCHTLPPGTDLTITAARQPLNLAHVNSTPFSARLVAKFNLPVSGWRMNSD